MMSKKRCDALLNQIVEELAELGKAEGLTFRTRGGTFTDHGLLVKLEVMEVTDHGHQHTRESEDFRNRAYEFGLAAESLWSTFIRRGVEYQIRGLMPRRKRPVVVKRVDNGKEYLMLANSVREALNGPAENVS